VVVVEVPSAKPDATVGCYRPNPFTDRRKILVGKVETFSSLKEGVAAVVDLIGGFDKIVAHGDEVLLKPNFNTADSPPGSSDPDFVKAVIELLHENGAGKVILGESSTLRASTRNVLKETEMLRKAEEAGAEVHCFDEGDWKRVVTGGTYLEHASLPTAALKARKVVYVCCMKTHRFARFTLSLKLAVGFLKPSERPKLHMSNLEEKIADLNLVTHPDLAIMDGRKCFISGGPAKGEIREPGFILASGDRIAMDVEALETLQSYEGASLNGNSWEFTQIRRAVELGLGVEHRGAYEVRIL
jgi:uncharacterized protein (DUF362 family)